MAVNLHGRTPRRQAIPIERAGPATRLTAPIPVIVLVLGAIAIPIELRPFDIDSIEWGANARDVLANVLGFLPVGVALGGQRFWPALLTAGGVSVVAEVAQLFTVHRFPSPIDIVCNTAGAAIGVLISRRMRWGKPSIALQRGVGGAAALLAVTLLALMVASASVPTLRGWDTSAQLAVGDELTGGRAWHGTIHELAIVADALDADTIRRLAEAKSFSGLENVAFGPVQNVDVDGVRGKPLLSQLQSARFHDLIVARGAFTVLARFQPSSLNQTGPARIVTYSRSVSARNFTLGQQGAALVLRVRTRGTGLNAASPQLRTPRVLAPGREVFVAGVSDGRTSWIYVDGRFAARTNLTTATNQILPSLTVTMGLLTAVALIGLWQPDSLPMARFAAAIAGLAVGVLGIVAGAVSSLPFYAPWIPVLSLAGGSAVALALSPRGPRLHPGRP